MVFPWFSYGFPLVFLGFPNVYWLNKIKTLKILRYSPRPSVFILGVVDLGAMATWPETPSMAGNRGIAT